MVPILHPNIANPPSIQHHMKPLLAATLEHVNQVPFPVIASPKIDGMRCLIHNGKAYTRSMKPIPNMFVRSVLESEGIEAADGELVVRGSNFREAMSALRRSDSTPDFRYIIFDVPGLNPYWKRLSRIPIVANSPFDIIVSKTLLSSSELEDYEHLCLANGYEGVMLRRPDGEYKQGRSTIKEFFLVKMKRFVDAEATIIACHPLTHNENDPFTNELGLQARSKRQEGLIESNVLGSFEVQDSEGRTFSVGSGFTAHDRERYWQRRTELLGKKITYKSQAHKGGYDVPRCPIFKCLYADSSEC